MKQTLKMYLSVFQDELIKTKAFIFKNWIMAKRNLFAIFEVIFWPLISFLSVGLLSDFINLSPSMKGFILIGVIAMSTIQVCQLDVAYVLLYDMWSKALKHSFVAPIGMRHLFIGSTIVGIIRGGAVFFILSFLSKIIFKFDALVPSFKVNFLFLLALFLNSAIIGILVSILVLTVGYKAEVAAWSLVSLMFLVCGIYYPVSVLPDWIRNLAELLPLTYFLEYYRKFYGFQPCYDNLLLKGYTMIFFYLFCESVLMKWAIKKAKRNGMLIKLSE